MDESLIRKIADENLPRLLWELQLNMWSVRLEVANLDGLDAQCSFRAEYEQATITIDPSKAHTEEDVLDCLRHELFHLLHADYNLARNMIAEIVDAKQFNIIDHAFSYAAEKTVLRLERAFDHGLEIPLKPETP